MIKRVFLLACCLIALSGCKSTMGKTIPLSWEQEVNGRAGEVVTVAPGENITDAFTGERIRILIVHNNVRGEDAFATVDYPAASYGKCATCLEEDDQYYYFHHPDNGGRLKVVGGNTFWSRAGYRASKANPSDVVPFRYVEFGDSTMTPDTAPVFEYSHAVDLESNYHFRQINFVSLEDDILTLRRAEEKGPSKGLGSQADELTLQFDLLESKDIEFEEARFTVLEASPDRLVVKIIKGVTL